ncbi:MAG: potassium/proton antiporter [Phenylobacterium sp.]|uniref:potassium/proton antiporter n=1 Tax=Phenylobacterium sp. TaxID=1871053 RepID=UPI0025FAF751|nr:potassium/proton antiporter [Phenylobacterium sp.]MCG9917015.1 potassium/proton antiporter [Phenylobacterium sp.]
MLSLSPELFLLVTGVLLLTTVLAGTLSSRFGVPALIGFLALGMLAGSDGPGGIGFADYQVAQTIGVACLIFILFSGGLDTPWKAVRRVLTPALALATVGVLISAGIVSLSAVLLLDFTPLQGFLLGSVIASTDAAAVFAVLRNQETRIREDVLALIELESGSNDPMAIFLVGVALALIAAPTTPLVSFVPDFILQMVLGAGIGLLVGYAFTVILARAKLRQGGLFLVISVAAALLAFGLAGVLAGSGFLAAYVAGVLAGNRDYPGRRAVSQFQDGLAWLAQVVMFLTLGLLVFPHQLPAVALDGLAITAVLMLVARPISVFVSLAPFGRFDWRAKLFVSWAGLRGAVPIVLATFGIVAGVKDAQAMFNIVFFVVLASSIIQGPTIGLLAKQLGLVQRPAAKSSPPDDIDSALTSPSNEESRP